MVLTGATLAAVLGLSSLTAVSLALFAASHFGPDGHQAKRAANGAGHRDEGIVFLFDRSSLVDATRAGERLIAAAPNDGSDWVRLMSLLLPEFPELQGRIDRLAGEGLQTYTSRDETTRLTAEWRDGLRRLTLVDYDVNPPTAEIDAHNLAALERELDTLRANTDFAPFMVWRQNREGRISWFNRRYLEEIKRVRGKKDAGRWPAPALFDTAAVADSAEKSTVFRASLETKRKETWYDVHVHHVGDEMICSAINIDKVVGAEQQLRAFMQTLTKTFADLSVGLAIFDRARRLVMFNPALADLSGLPIGFLAAHPTLFGFLDRMRDLGRVPEPRNYTEWRKNMADLEEGAVDGTYLETWTLATGQTFRVTGQPHPDGAIAFVFEDISAEISLTRRFRSEVEARQSVLDQMEEAVAVFSGSGAVTMVNSAYVDLWGHDPLECVENVGLADVISTWSSASLPSAMWTEGANFIRNSRGRDPWITDATLLDGRAISCRFVGLPGGATMVGFRPLGRSSRDVELRRRA